MSIRKKRTWLSDPDKTETSDYQQQITQSMQTNLDQDQLTNCMRCGFCLPACPTYRETGLEAASPRGRIALMKAVNDGLMSPDESFHEQIDLCLGCRACETACPAGVTYGRLLEQTRSSMAKHQPKSRYKKWLRNALLKKCFPYPHRLRVFSYLLSIYQNFGIQKIARVFKFTSILPEQIRQMERIMPRVDPRGSQKQMGEIIRPNGKKIGRVGMFRGCMMDVMFTETNKNTIRILTTLGYEVIFPDTQTCCGALHSHAGEEHLAKELARRNIHSFKEAQVDWIVSNAGGCGAQLVEYAHLLNDDTEFAEDARWLSERIKDVSQLVMEQMDLLSLWHPKSKRISYQDSCHLCNGMKVTGEPRRILQSISGAEYVELFEADRCCGSAGIYNLTHPEMSMNILDEKMEHVRATQADTIITSNPGCLLQMKLGIERAGLQKQMRAVHIVDFIMEALEPEHSEHSPMT